MITWSHDHIDRRKTKQMNYHFWWIISEHNSIFDWHCVYMSDCEQFKINKSIVQPKIVNAALDERRVALYFKFFCQTVGA